jgi:hypothetical protein
MDIFYMSYMGDFEDYMPTYDEFADFFQGLNMGLNFDDNVYNYILEEFDPEYDPTTIDALMNWLNAPSGETDYIMGELDIFYMEFMGDMHGDYMPTYEEVEGFVNQLYDGLHFDDNVYDYMMMTYDPYDQMTVDELMMMMMPPPGEEQYFAGQIEEYYMSFH